MHKPHKPENYIAGAFIHTKEEWHGDFEATAGELFHYAEHDVRTVEEYSMVLDMLEAQQVYELWWDKARKNTK